MKDRNIYRPNSADSKGHGIIALAKPSCRRRYEDLIYYQTRGEAKCQGLEYLASKVFCREVSSMKGLTKSLAETILSGKPGVYLSSVCSSSDLGVAEYWLDEKLGIEMQEFNYSQKLMDDVKLCFWEAYVNAVVHGNRGGPKRYYKERGYPIPDNIKDNQVKPVEVSALVSNNFLLSRVIDTGSGPSEEVIKSITNKKIGYNPSPEELLALSGRGLQVIKSLTDEIHAYKTQRSFSMSAFKLVKSGYG
jgi:anti-sigma regulatory factor (Ser/Thr protein kinase)